MPLETITNTLGFSTTKHSDNVLNISPMDVHLSESGAGSSEVSMMQDTMYMLDALRDFKQYKKADYPLLSILANIQHSKAEGSTKYWSDAYESEAWVDIMLDDLRASDKKHIWSDGAWTNVNTETYITAANRGKIAFNLIGTIPSAGVNLTAGNEIKDDSGGNYWEAETPTSDLLYTMCFNKSDDYIVGKKEAICRKLAATLNSLDYTYSRIEGSSKNYIKFLYTSGTSHPLYFCFEDLAYMISTTQYQDHEIIVALNYFMFNEDFSELIFQFDFANSNADMSSASTHWLSTQEIVGPTAEGYAAGTSKFTGGGYTRISRLALIQDFSEVDDAVPEGSEFVEGSGFIFNKELKRTYSRIFQSKAWGVTGTRIAEKVTFMDEFVETRKKYMARYKRGAQNAIYYARSFIRVNSSGKPVHSFGGLFDYSLYPIRYIKEPLPTVGTSEDHSGMIFYEWLQSISKAINQHKEGDGNSFTVLCSDYIITRISHIIQYVKSNESKGNVYGYHVNTNPPTENNLMIPNIEIVIGTAKTRLHFVYEKSLDYMPSMPTQSASGGGIPGHLFSAGISPRNLMIVVDKTNAFMETLRNDTIIGNLQAKGEDQFKEAMRGEHIVYFRFPKNFTIIDATEA